MPKVFNKICEICGIEFETGSNRTKYCVSCRKEKQLERNLAYKQNKADGKVRRLGSTQVCDECGKPFTLNSASQRTCNSCSSIRKKKKRSASNTKYRNNTYDQIVLYVKKGEREELKEYVASKNMSMNEFVNNAIISYKKLLDK